ncbi:hypothetical protein Hhel01_01845 [Haloferula helveola]
MGAVVALFLVWAWVDSMWWSTEINRSSEAEIVGLHSRIGGIYIDHVQTGSGGTPRSSAVFLWGRHDNDDRIGGEGIESIRASASGWFPTFHASGWGDARGFKAFVPYWMILLAWVTLWTLTLVLYGRWQRKRLAVRGS